MIVASNVLTLYSIVAVGSLSLFPCSFRLDGTWFRAVTNIHADDKHIRTHTLTHTNERASDVLYRNRHSKGKCKGASYLYNAKWSVWKRVSKRDGRWNISICCLFLPLAWSKPVATLRLTTRAQNSFRALHFQADVISKLLTQFISLCVCVCFCSMLEDSDQLHT